MKKNLILVFILGFLICMNPIDAQKKKEIAKEPEKKEKEKKEKEPEKNEKGLTSSTFSGLSFRSIGPAWASGRISDFAVNPKKFSYPGFFLLRIYLTISIFLNNHNN